MKTAFQHIGIWLLLVIAQHGAAVHELSHLAGVDAGSRAQLTGGGSQTDATCALCPAFAQAACAALSVATPSLHLAPPSVARDTSHSLTVWATAPGRPRNRGPPSNA